VSLEIFSSGGEKMHTLMRGKPSPGVHRVQWDGRDDRGGQVASGVYFYRLEAGRYLGTRKLAVVK
jgi:flagellar hook assembly protein FlgD